MLSGEEEHRLKHDLLKMFGYMNGMRRELAHLEGEGVANFTSMADTLDAIVESTETAGNAILESMEAIESTNGKLRGLSDAKVTVFCDEISDSANKVFEACAFQDLTGQRISRIVKSLQFVEEHVNALVRMWGRDELAELAEELNLEKDPTDTDQALLNGPQRCNAAISQDDIDKLFA